MRISTCITLIATLVCAACDSGNSTLLELNNNGIESFATVSTPVQLRNVPLEDLHLRTRINGNEQLFDHNHNHNGEWVIQFSTLQNVSNSVVMEWYVRDHLIIEESGDFDSSSTTAITMLDLDYTSAGDARFDTDCDGISNLEELNNGTQINDFSATGRSMCDDNKQDIDLADTEYGWVSRWHKNFKQDGVTQRVTDYKQVMQVVSISPDSSAVFYTELHSNEYELPNGKAASHYAAMGFGKSEGRPKNVVVIFNASIDARPDRLDGVCHPNARPNVGFRCTLPFDWKEGRAYRFRLREKSNNVWRATVYDLEADEFTRIATFTSESKINWTKARNILSVDRKLTPVECRTGVQPIRARYRAPIVNGSHTLGTRSVRLSKCVQAGAGWSEGIKIVEDEPEYSLNLGIPQ